MACWFHSCGSLVSVIRVTEIDLRWLQRIEVDPKGNMNKYLRISCGSPGRLVRERAGCPPSLLILIVPRSTVLLVSES